MVVGVRAGEEAQARHARRVEARDVGRLIRILLQRQIEAGGDVRLLDDPRPRRARAGRLHRQLVVLHPADHVEVQVRGDLIERHGRRCRERARADQARAPRPTRSRAARCGGAAASRALAPIAEHRGRARRVVVGAVMHLARRRPCRPASCRLRRGRGDRSARRARPTAWRRRRPASSPAGSATTLWPVRFSRSTAACTVTVTSGQREAGDVRVARRRAPSAPRRASCPARREHRARRRRR